MEKIKNYILNNGGISLDIDTMENITENHGYMVSLENYETIKNNINDTIKTIKEYIKVIKQLKENKQTKNKKYFVGVWLDNGVYYIDISILIQNKRDAVNFGKANKQKGIFDLKNNNTIYLNYNITFYSLYKKIYDNKNSVIDEKILTTFDDIKAVSDYIKKSLAYTYNILNNKINDDIFTIYKDTINIKDL